MGNSYIGKIFEVGVYVASSFKPIDDMNENDALRILDMIGMMEYVYGSDAEFDDLLDYCTDMSILMCKAFCPELLEKFPDEPDETDEEFMEYDKLRSECIDKFLKRYKFC